ncbi:tetratricopeptide repeat protein [bacterium]|nr:tetratricopeptide repeat protein [bacterium]
MSGLDQVKSLVHRMLLVVALGLVGIGASCEKAPVYLVPEVDTAREQFQVAETQRRTAQGIFEEDTRKLEMQKAILAYRAVEKRFPQDETYTPVASLLIGNIYEELEDFQSASKQFEHVLQAFPNDDQVRISALYGMGFSLDELDRASDAQKYYKLVIDEYSNTTDPEMRRMVEQAIIRYRQIRPTR